LNDPDTTTLYQNLTSAFGDPSMADFIMAYRFLGAYTPAPAAPAGGGAGGRGRGPTIPTITTNSPSPITSNQFNMSGTAKQSIPSLFSLVTAKVAITKQGSVGTATRGNTGRGGGGAAVAVTPTTVTIYSSPLADQSKLTELLPVLLDKCTTRNLPELPARLNVNTASMDTLAAMPGLTETDIQQIISVRPPPGDGEWADPIYQTPAWLVTEAQLSPAKLAALEKYITAQTEVYRIQVLGYFDKGGPIARIEAVVDTNAGHPRFIYWRDLSELQKGFDFER
jgi:DNA uptake protein ComE-like DNA-binding protein